MTVNPTTADVRAWLSENGYEPGTNGRVSAEKRDMCIASTEGYVPKLINVVKYVNDVRQWMMDSGNGIERSMSIAPHWYRRFNTEQQLEDSTDIVLERMENEPIVITHDDGTVEHWTLAELEGNDMNEPNAADIKAMEAAEAEAHKTNQEKYTGTAFVTLQMNLQFASLVTTALFEAHSALGRVFNTDGTPTETAYEDLGEVVGCLKQASVFLHNLTSSFRPAQGPVVYELNADSPLGKAIAFGLASVPLGGENTVRTMAGTPHIGKRMNLNDHETTKGTVIGFDPASTMFMIRLDDGTTHWLYPNEFNITD